MTDELKPCHECNGRCYVANGRGSLKVCPTCSGSGSIKKTRHASESDDE